MFHLAAVNYMDDWDKDARLEVAQRVLVSPDDLKLPQESFNEVIKGLVLFICVSRRDAVFRLRLPCPLTAAATLTLRLAAQRR